MMGTRGRAEAAQPMPGAWRGGPDTEVGKAIAVFFAAKSESVHRSTALHDFTDFLRAGIKGLDKAVWGVENRVLSGLVSLVGGGRY